MLNVEDIYTDFASKISFLEFIQEEFRPANLPVDNLQTEISLLASKKYWNIADLSEYVGSNPKSFFIFEAIFQLHRFTNAQLIHFLFDITKLNSANLEPIYEYMILNLKHDQEFRRVYLTLFRPKLSYEDFVSKLDTFDKKHLIATFKMAVTKYMGKASKDFKVIEFRMTKREFEDIPIRLANYLLNNLKMNETLTHIDVEKFLRNKRIPLDTKRIHGSYAKLKIMEHLDKKGYLNADSLLKQNSTKTLKLTLDSSLIPCEGKKFYCTEKYIEGIIKPNGKPKKFDLVIFRDKKPMYLFEINFYSTEGTKIGINEGEYVDLNNFIKENFSQYRFYWVTDGNYWLTPQGKSRFISLLGHFDQILNIHTFAEKVESFT